MTTKTSPYLISKKKPGRVLIVAGSDPTAGAGLQADLKTVTRMGGYGMTAVTAITVQNTQTVFSIFPVAGALVAHQMRVCLEDIGADCIKLGMLANQEIVEAVHGVLTEFPHIPVVADPVLTGTGGGILLEPQSHAFYIKHLLPRITLLTPNLPEAAALTGLPVTTLDEMRRAAHRLIEMGAKAALITGGHLPGDIITDFLHTPDEKHEFTAARILGPGFHGTGCVLASAIATTLATGGSLHESVTMGRMYVRGAIKKSLTLGKGQRLLGGDKKVWNIKNRHGIYKKKETK